MDRQNQGGMVDRDVLQAAQGRVAVTLHLNPQGVIPPIRKVIAEYIQWRVHARMTAEEVDRSDSATVERLLREEVARFNAETTSAFRIVLHQRTDRQRGFQVSFDVV